LLSCCDELSTQNWSGQGFESCGLFFAASKRTRVRGTSIHHGRHQEKDAGYEA
jgi:hypothetical protein